MHASAQEERPAAPAAVGKTAAKIRAVTEAAASAADAPARVIVPVPPTVVKLAEYERSVFDVYPGDDLTLADFTDPKLWQYASQHGPRRWRLHDFVNIWQSQRLTHCVVADEGLDFTTLHVLESYELPAQRSAMERTLRRGYSIRRGRPGQDPFIVYRDIDEFPMSAGQGFRSFEAAFRWAYDNPSIGPERDN